VTNFESIVRDLGATLLGINAAHALFAGAMAWEHRDPFDRMLAAQALRENLTFVTRDATYGALHA
jgi:PIN domain nuclease of toxin-antitoxin system